MSATVQADAELPLDLIERVQSLSRPARQKLGDMISKMDEAPPDDPELVRKEVNELIADRVEGYLSGRYKTVDAEEMYQEVLQEFLKDHPQ